jgi:hypothetical protein
MRAQPVEDPCNMALPVHVLHDPLNIYMNTHELLKDVGLIALARHQQHLPATKKSGTCKSAYSLSNRTDHGWVTTMKRLDKVISFLN